MRFKTLTVENFKAIDRVELLNLKDLVVIAGPNGCGKSCILDAIRFLKSAYGGYQLNEWHQWFGEFHIDFNDPQAIRKVLRKPDRPLVIEADMELGRDEVEYLRNHPEGVIVPRVWRRNSGQPSLNARTRGTYEYRRITSGYRTQIDDEVSALRGALETDYGKIRLELQPSGEFNIEPNFVMEVVFDTYDPDHIGIIDHHSASRNYQRESLGGIDLNVRNFDSQRASQALYNPQAKYSNVKTELAASYVRELVATAAGLATSEPSLNDTLQELFETFFPEKEYLGVLPDPDGSLRFPVKTPAGEHDINELSSGEKEIVYGYLRLRNSAPRNSTILLDEPELHLNPGLIRNMPSFYYRHLGRARSNQLWLVTHSDALLRHSVGNNNYSVYHMSHALKDFRNQVAPIVADDELERATIGLVGDLATFQPRSKVIILEGGGDLEFDALLIRKLFPETTKRVNLISGGSKRRVKELHAILAEVAKKIGLTNRFFMVVDRDADPEIIAEIGTRRHQWGAYHIENYLLSEKYIMRAANEISSRELFVDEASVAAALEKCARSIAPHYIMSRMTKELDSQIVRCIRVSGNPSTIDPVAALSPSLNATFARLEEVRREILVGGLAERVARTVKSEVAQALETGGWRDMLPGRDILKAFVASLGGGIDYERFRLLVLSRMADAGYQPSGIARVLDNILSTEVDV